jgi:hypothetical protein
MPGIIDSAPSCIQNVNGAQPPDDAADFVLQKAYENCAGFMTFGPGSTYGEDGAGANGAYYVITVLGIVVMLAVIIYWVYWENRRLHAHRLVLRGSTGAVEAD